MGSSAAIGMHRRRNIPISSARDFVMGWKERVRTLKTIAGRTPTIATSIGTRTFLVNFGTFTVRAFGADTM
jgi:hypothetical protein